jgi:serine/threonine-protein kinase
VPAALEGVIKRALQKRPEQRYAGAEEMQRDLLALGGAPIAEPPTVMMPPIAPPHAATPLSPPAAAPLAPVPEPEVEEKRRSRTGLVIALVLVVLIAAAVAAWALGLFGGGGGVLVPDLVGKDLAQARATLSDAGLKVGDVGYADGSTAETPGVAVQKQAPKSGAEVEEGATVDLTMSADLVAVTDVVGQSEAVAVNMLTQAGLKLDRVQRRQSDKVEAGLVIEQAPQAGTRVPKGSTFTLVVSKGAAPATVPDVEGESQAAAETALEGAGYTVNVVEQPSDTVPAGIVIEQNPSAGVEAAKGSRVTIVVSTGPPVSPTSTPTPTDSPSPAG